MTVCPFTEPTKPETPRTCWGCGKDIRGTGRQKWCGPDCEGHRDRWLENHAWWMARPAALKAARVSAIDLPESFTHQVEWLTHQGTRTVVGGYSTSNLSAAGPFSQLWECARCGSLTDAPEVNHIEPWTDVTAPAGKIPSRYRRSTRNDQSCKNHLSNLEVLDHECHRIETAAQARERGRERRLVNVGRDARVRGQAALL